MPASARHGYRDIAHHRGPTEDPGRTPYAPALTEAPFSLTLDQAQFDRELTSADGLQLHMNCFVHA